MMSKHPPYGRVLTKYHKSAIMANGSRVGIFKIVLDNFIEICYTVNYLALGTVITIRRSVARLPYSPPTQSPCLML